MPTLLPLLLVMPLAAAVAAALLGPRRADAVRPGSASPPPWLSLAVAVAVAVQFIDLNRREPLDDRAHTFSRAWPCSSTC